MKAIHRSVPCLRPLRCLILPLLLAGLAPSAPAAEILGESTAWRTNMLWLPEMVGTQAEAAWRRGYPTEAYDRFAVLPEGWTRWDFDDLDWPRETLPLFGGHGYRQPREVAAILARSAFEITAAPQARELTLRVTYRGGVAVYLNGQEMGRRHLPEGDLTPATLAEDYPADAFLTEEGGQIGPPGERADTPEIERRLDLRIRSFEIRLPRTALRPGRNVLALRVHRAATRADMPSYAGGRASWNTAGLISATLTADRPGGIVPHLGAPSGVQTWNASSLHEIRPDTAYADPGQPVRPLSLVAARGGSASGVLAASRREGLAGRQVRARMSPLRHEHGQAFLPATAAEVRFARMPVNARGEPVGYFDILSPEPLDEATVQPVWFTIDVPAQAAPGRYHGAVEVSHGHGTPARVALTLDVSPFTLPHPSRYRTFLGLMQSPDTPAHHYQVPLYSDLHFRYLEAALARLGRTGSSVLYATAVRETHFGNEHAMIRFRERGGQAVPDFSVFDRYLDLFARQVGPPQRIVVQVWTADMDTRGQRTREVKLTRIGARGDAEAWTQPVYGEPGTEDLWRPVADGLRERMARRGRPADTLAWGIGIDHRPHPDTVAFFRRIAPDVGWALFTHGRGDPRPREGELEIQGMRVTYLVHPYTPRQGFRRRSGEFGGWDNPFLFVSSMRAAVTGQSSPASYRILVDAATRDQTRGVARIGFDFWPQEGTLDRRGAGLLTRYRTSNVLDINLMRDNPRSLTAPGPQGPLGTVRLEMLREGRQLAEARIVIENALLQEGRPDDAAFRWQQALDRHAAAIDLADRHGPWYAASGWLESNREILTAAAEAQAFLGRSGR